MVVPLGISPGLGSEPSGSYDAKALLHDAGALLEPDAVGELLGAGWGSGVAE
jgi:hypothetical protein